jgi:hypothetical protein
LNWNIRGLNADDKRNAVRAKIEESACAIFSCMKLKFRFLSLLGHENGSQMFQQVCICSF